MILKILVIWTIVVEISLCLSPSLLIALAKLHTQHTKAIGNALNWKFKNNYKKALSKSKTPLYMGNRYARHLEKRDTISADDTQNKEKIADRIDDIKENKLEDQYGRYDENYDNLEENRSDLFDDEYYGPENQITMYGPLEEEEHSLPKSASADSDHDKTSLFYQHFPYFSHQSNVDHPHFKSMRFGTDNAGVDINIAMNHHNPFFSPRNMAQSLHQKPSEDELVGEANHEDETPSEQNAMMGEESQTNADADHELEKLRTFSFLPFYPQPDSQPSYQNPSKFDPSKPENKQDLVKFLDGQTKFWENIWSKPDKDKFHYNGPKFLNKPSLKPQEPYSSGPAENQQPPAVDYGQESSYQPEIHSDDKHNQYDLHDQGYGYSVPKPLLPTAMPVKISPLVNGKYSKLLNIKHDGYANFIEGLQAKGDLLVDMLRPVTTKMDAELMKELMLLNKLNKNLFAKPVQNQQDYHEAYVSQPLETPENHFHIVASPDVRSSKDPLVGHIIQIPNNYYNNHYRRAARSTDNPAISEDYLQILIQEGSEILNFLRKMAKNEEDILLLEYFGASVIEGLSQRMDNKIEKRSIPVAHLIMDPSTKLDLSKTVENLGTLVKTVLDHHDTPMYHVRNLVGSAKDVVLSTMKIPNQNIIAPSGYNIIDNPNKDETFNNEITGLSSRFGGEDNGISSYWPQEMVSATFQQVGQVIRDSVRSSQEAINHVGEITNHAKKAILSAKNTPELVKQSIAPLPIVPATQPISVKSRFGDDDENVGASEKTSGKFLHVGHLLDAVGVSNPNRELPSNSKRDGYINSIHKKLNGMKETLGVNDIHDFILQIKEKLRELRENNPLNIMQIECGGKRFRRDTENNHLQPTSSNHHQTISSAQEDETVSSSFIPIELTHPFLNFPFFSRRNTDTRRLAHPDDFWFQQGYEPHKDPVLGSYPDPYPFKSCSCQSNPRILDHPEIVSSHFGSVLGASNSEKMKKMTNSGVVASPKEVLKNPENHDDEKEIVSTLMKIGGNMVTPFAGLATEKEKEKFHKQFQPKVEYGYYSDINGDYYDGYPYYQ